MSEGCCCFLCGGELSEYHRCPEPKRRDILPVDALRAVTAVCLITCTAAACYFVVRKTQNDSSIAEDTKRIADAAELAYWLKREHRPKQDHSTPLSMRF